MKAQNCCAENKKSLQDKRIGFIGGGAIAEAIIRGISAQGLMPAQILVHDIVAERLDYLKSHYGTVPISNAKSLVSAVDILFLTVKPQVAEEVLGAIAPVTPAETTVVSVITGLSLRALEERFTPGTPIIRVMPNTPVAVGAGMSVLAPGRCATKEQQDAVLAVFSAVGRAVVLDERAMDAVTGLSGSGPGYVFLILDALADAGVRVGLPRKTALELAAQTILGAAKMVLDTGEHPAKLRDMVTSPGGTTIAGLQVLEQRALRGAIIDAVVAATARAKELGSQ